MTRDTSHSPIGPCSPDEQSPTGDKWRHAPIAPLSSALFSGENVIAAQAVVAEVALVLIRSVRAPALAKECTHACEAPDEVPRGILSGKTEAKAGVRE